MGLSRAAIPGDICLLLQPDIHQTECLQQTQQTLIKEFGGRYHQDIHFTIQRFEMDIKNLEFFISSLEEITSAIEPFVIFGTGLRLSYHKFWNTNLLRWTIQQSPALNNLLHVMEDAIIKNNGIVHYPFIDGWQPSLITAIENPNGNFPKEGILFEKPKKIFQCRDLIVSEIVSNEKFKIHGKYKLGKNHMFSNLIP